MKLPSFLLALPFVLALGCHSGAHLSAPDGFAELEPGDAYSYRATSAAGVVIGVRSEKNDPRGNLEFWTSAVDLKLRKAGYSPMDEKPAKVAAEGGLEGKRVRYTIDRSGRPHEYWVTVFVTDSRVIVVEAAGDHAYFDKETQREIEAATKTVHAS